MNAVAERMGGRRFVLPTVAALLLGCVLSLVFYPMTHMEARDLPFAILNLDEGATTASGDVNAGQQMADGLVGAPNEAIEWTVVGSEAELDAAMENNEYYGAVVIPADFTARQLEAAAGEGSAQVQVLLDNAKSPLVATQMSASVPALFAEQGIDAQVQTLHAGTSTTATNPLLSQQLSVMPLVMLSLVASIIVAFIVAPLKGTSGAGRRRQVMVQLATVLVTSAVIGVTVWVIVTSVGGFSLSAAGIVFFWLASAAIMTLLVGAFDVLVLLGVLVALCVFALGMPCGALPVEMMPSFWQSWVYPWAPQHFIGSGMRDIAYMGAGVWPSGASHLAVICCVGLVLLAAAAFMGRGGRNADGVPSEGIGAVSEDDRRPSEGNGAASERNGAASAVIGEQAVEAESGQPSDVEHTA